MYSEGESSSVNENSPVLASSRRRRFQSSIDDASKNFGMVNNPDEKNINKRNQVHRAPLILSRATELPFSSMRDGANSSEMARDSELCVAYGVFALCFQLHGCLCEAPLAVLEGLIRAPCYLLAAAWVAIVAKVGAFGLEE